MSGLMDDITLKKLHEVEIEILDEIVRICNENNLDYFLIGGTLLGAVRHKGFIPWDDDLDIAMPRQDYEKFLQLAKTELNSIYMIDNKNYNKDYYLNFTKIRKKNTIFEQDFQINYNAPKGNWVDIFPLDKWKKENGILQNLKVRFIKMLRSIAHYKSGIILGNNKVKLKKIIGFLFKPIPTYYIMNIADNLMKSNMKKNTKYFINISSQYDFKKQTILKEKFFPVKELEFEGNLYKVPGDYEYWLERIYGDYMKLPPVEDRITHNPARLNFNIKNKESGNV